MADTDHDGREPLFRASKRRKVFRKRRGSYTGEHEGGCAGEDEIEQNSVEDGNIEEGASRVRRPGGVRKNGIAFANTQNRRETSEQQSEETALVPVSQNVAVEEELQNDRFVKPTGREVVTEDKHMMAYVDSKLAEMRSSAAPIANTNTGDGMSDTPMISEAGLVMPAAAATTSDERILQRAQARSDRAYQRPTKRPRRKWYERDEADIARDAYIEQFMQEAQVPLYDRPSEKAGGRDATGDNDAAAAEAFKAQLLADMETNRRRPPKSAAAKAENATSGPKLGGSRQQREKMRAIQAEEGKK